MIISASYKTDIPTFYGEWFMNRVRAGYCKMINPYNQRVIRVSLHPDRVEGIVFWSKNVGPFLKRLGDIEKLGFPFVLQHTITGYPREIEQAVVDDRKAIANMKAVAADFGPRVAVWRYDPVIFSSITPHESHIENFTRIARELEGSTDEVVVSFSQLYAKTKRNMDLAASENNFTWSDPSDSWKTELTEELAEISINCGIRLTICSQPQFIAPGCYEARCVDANRLADIVGSPLKACLKGNRKECGCFESRDIGDYDTCPHGCVYCYAVKNQTLAKTRFKKHDPKGETLFPLPSGAIDSDENQPDLFT